MPPDIPCEARVGHQFILFCKISRVKHWRPLQWGWRHHLHEILDPSLWTLTYTQIILHYCIKSHKPFYIRLTSVLSRDWYSLGLIDQCTLNLTPGISKFLFWEITLKVSFSVVMIKCYQVETSRLGHKSGYLQRNSHAWSRIKIYFCWIKVHFVGLLIASILHFLWPSPWVSKPGWFSWLHLLVHDELQSQI